MATTRICGGDPTKPTPNPNAIELQNLIYLQGGTEIDVECRKPIQIAICPAVNSVVISAQTPVHIFVIAPTRISAQGRLDEGFVHGWRKLPDELKVKILGYNLVFQRVIRVDSMEDGTRDFTNGRMLRKHLAMGPDFASLSLQVFSEQNTFVIHYFNYKLPPLRFRQYITKVTFKIDFLEPRCWEMLEKLAAGSLGFRGVQHITLSLFTWFTSFESHALDRLPGKRVRFACKGRLCMDGGNNCNFLGNKSISGLRLKQHFQDLITFAE